MPTQSTDSTALSTTSNCPKCGCPAWYIQTPAVVRCAIGRDGLILKGRHNQSIVSLEGGIQTLECGGGHTWNIVGPRVVL